MLYISKREIIHIRTCILFWTTKILRINTVLEKKLREKQWKCLFVIALKKPLEKDI